MVDNISKWDDYYRKAEENNDSPPWESNEPFHGLVKFIEENNLEQNSKFCEFGCGSSSSCFYMSQKGYQTTAIKRAKRMYGESVNWVQMDILNQQVKEEYDMVFDIDFNQQKACQTTYDILRQNGYAMVVTGAFSNNQLNEHSGPPKLKQEELVNPYIEVGFTLHSIELSHFNSTPVYQKQGIPRCWIAIFKKI